MTGSKAGVGISRVEHTADVNTASLSKGNDHVALERGKVVSGG